MLFSSMIFLWGFLPIVFLLYFMAKEQYRNYILLIASIIFYAWGEPIYILLMLLSISCNYVFGLCIHKTGKQTVRRIWLIVCVTVNLGLLWYFKYSTTFFSLVNRIVEQDYIKIKEIILPIGISFYTFQAMSYVIDLYREEIPVQKNILNLALYISFFPQLIAGPIVKYKEVNEQLEHRIVKEDDLAYGIKRFIYGLGKKVLISNTVAAIADNMFAVGVDNLGTALTWFAVAMYTLQIYFDFSGYSDMAIGLGRIFGFRFMENFNYPYISQSIKEFWRRWHISLSGWFRDYVYIPLGGNRKGKFRTYFNLFIVFLLTGIWHGASLNFLCWGLWHGFFIVIERLGFGRLLEKNPMKIFNHIYTMLIVVIGWAMFRCSSVGEAITILKAMGTLHSANGYVLRNFVTNYDCIVIVLGILFCGVVQKAVPRIAVWFHENNNNVLEYILLFAVMGLSIMSLVSGTYNPFIYFQF